MPERPKFGEILVQAGAIDEMQLRAALGEQKRWGQRLGVTLVKMGIIEERDLVRALARQLEIPVVQLEGKGLISRVPRTPRSHRVLLSPDQLPDLR